MTALVRPPVRDVRSRFFDSARWAGYRARPDDIIIATYPKCGTTRTQRIVSMLLAGSAAPAPVAGPWPDMRLHGPVESVLLIGELAGRVAGGQPHRSEVRRRCARHAGGSGRVFPRLLADGGGWGDDGAGYWRLERSYWAARREANVPLMHFADMKTDLTGEVRRLSRFLEIDHPPALLKEIVAAAEFEAMRADGEALMPRAQWSWRDGSQTFLHKGVNVAGGSCSTRRTWRHTTSGSRKSSRPGWRRGWNMAV